MSLAHAIGLIPDANRGIGIGLAFGHEALVRGARDYAGARDPEAAYLEPVQ